MLLSTLELNWAVMSPVPGARSDPESLFPSAIGYHVLAMSAPEKSEITEAAPALPRTPLVESQGVSGSNVASTSMVTWLGRMEPQIRPAPGLPPMGETGVGSLTPSPAPSLFTRRNVAP